MMELPERLAACEGEREHRADAEGIVSAAGAPPLVVNEAFDTAGCLDAEAGYGLAAFRGAPIGEAFCRPRIVGKRECFWCIGVRWTLGPDIGFGVEGTKPEPGNDETAEHDIECRATMRW